MTKDEHRSIQRQIAGLVGCPASRVSVGLERGAVIAEVPYAFVHPLRPETAKAAGAILSSAKAVISERNRRAR